MTQQRIVEHSENIDGCSTCRSFRDNGVFLLCAHPLSSYSVAGRSDFHTCSHMRQQYGACGPDHKLRMK